jgi:hypothetical protein
LEKAKQELIAIKNDLEKISALYSAGFSSQFLSQHTYDGVKNVQVLSIAQERKLSDKQKSHLREFRENELALLEKQIQDIQLLLALHVDQLINNAQEAQCAYDNAMPSIQEAIKVWNNNGIRSYEADSKAYQYDLLREYLLHDISHVIDELATVINYYHGCKNMCIQKSTTIIAVLEHLTPAIDKKREWIAKEEGIVHNNIAIAERHFASCNILVIPLKNEARNEFEKQKKARAAEVLKKAECELVVSNFSGGPKKNNKKNDDDDNDEQPFGKYEDAPYHHKNSVGVKSVAPDNGQDALNRSIASTNQNSKRRYGVSQSGQYVVFDETSPGLYHGHVVDWNELSKVKGLQKELIIQEMALKSGKAIYRTAKKIVKRVIP